MSRPTPLLGDVRAVATDFPRDRMPQGYVWELTDWVPAILDSQLTARGGWLWGSNALTGPIDGGIYAPFMAGEVLLVAGGGRVYEVNQTDLSLVDRGAAPSLAQNPVMIGQTVVFPDRTKATFPAFVARDAAGAWTSGTLGAAPKGAYADVYKSRLVLGNMPGEEAFLRFSLSGDPTSYDSLSFWPTSQPVTGIKSLRNALVVFHKGSTERLRGNNPQEANLDSDFWLEPLYDVGTVFAQSIVHWNDNVIFADSRGVYITDGATVRNLCTQGGVQQLWRHWYAGAQAIAAGIFLDFYVTSIVRATDSIVLICDLNRRQWFTFSNIPALCFIPSVAAFSQLWAGLQGHNRLAALSTCFFHTVNDQIDADGAPVLPVIESGWQRFSKDEARKRIRHLYMSYDVRLPTALDEAERKVRVAQAVLQVLVKREPQQVTPYNIGSVYPSDGYTRRKLPVNKFPFGLSIRVEQIAPSAITRLYMVDLDVEKAEESRVSRNMG